MSFPWSGKAPKATPVNADELMIIDSEDSDPDTTNKRITLGSLPGGSGEANTSSNSGTGEGLAQTKVGVDLPFKSLLGETSRIILTGNTDDVTFTLDSVVVTTDKANTYGAFPQIFQSDEFCIENPVTTNTYQFVASEITLDRQVTLPLLTANDTFVFEDFAQVLANKTLTDPIITNFTNATHDHSTAGNGGQLTNSALVSGVFSSITGLGIQTQDLDMGTFNLENSRLPTDTNFISDSIDSTKLLAFNVSGFTTATTRTITIPDTSGTIVFEAFAQILTNKVIDASFNTLSNIAVSDLADGVDGELITWDSAGVADTVATGTSGQVLTSNGVGTAPTFEPTTAALPVPDSTPIVEGSADATKLLRFEIDGFTSATTRVLTPPDSDGTLVLEGFTQTLTNKTLTAPIISTISNTGTLTLPTSTDTLVGKATTDTFTNKTFDANATGNSLSNVEVADLANATDGELITWDAAGAPDTVAVGTSGQVLTSNGAGAAPTFQPVGAATLPVPDNTNIVEGEFDATKLLRFDVGGNNTLIQGVLATQFTTAKTLTFPDATDTLVGKNTTDIFTNKTIDSSVNSISNIVVSDLADATDGELITWDAAGAPDTVAVGISGQVLTSNGVGAAPTFQAAGAGSSISQLDTSITVTDTGSDGTASFLIDGTAKMSMNVLRTLMSQTRFELAQATTDSNISSNVVTLNNEGNYFEFNNTVATLDGISSTDWQAGSIVYLRFRDANATGVTLTNNAVVTAPIEPLILIGGTDFTVTNADDEQIIPFMFDGAQWIQLARPIEFSTGDVVGPASSTDDALVTFNGTTGKSIQESTIPVIMTAAGEPTWPRAIKFTNFTSLPPSTDTYIQSFFSDITLNTSTGNITQFSINAVTAYTFAATVFTTINKNINIGTAYYQLGSIASPASTGSDEIGRLFLDLDNSDHLTIQRNGVEVDLEAAGSDTPWTEDHDAAGFNLEFKTASPIIMGQGATDVLSITYLDDTANAGVRIGNTDGFVLIENESAVANDAQTVFTMRSGGATTIQNIMNFTVPTADDTGSIPYLRMNFEDSAGGTVGRPLLEITNAGTLWLEISNTTDWTFHTATEFIDLAKIHFVNSTTDAAVDRIINLDAADRITWNGAATSTPNSILFTGTDIFQVFINNALQFQVTDTTANFLNGTIQGVAGYEFQTGTADMVGTSTDLELNGPTNVSIHIGDTEQYSFDGTFFDMQANNIRNLAAIRGDLSGTNEILTFSEIASAVNEINIINAISTVGPTISATGGDTDIDLNLASKGSGFITFTTPALADTNVQLKYGGTVASASSMSAFQAGNSLQVTGTTTINFLVDDIFFQAGHTVTFQFADTLTLTHNASSPPTNFAVMLLKGDVDYTTTAGDMITFVFNGLEWLEVSRASAVTPGIEMNGRFQGSQGADVASADAITLGDGNYFDITGVTTINHMINTDWQSGSTVTLQFDSTPTVTNAAGGAAGAEQDFALAGAANFVATAGDTLTLVNDGTLWREISRSVN